jgi:DNA mismatch endonuclease (patch repair protein)
MIKQRTSLRGTKQSALITMADVHTKEQRSFNMSRIKSKNTQPEMLVRLYLNANGFLYKLHDKTLPGNPDIKCL